MRVLALLAAAVLLLAACDTDEHKGQHCEAHETILIEQPIFVGKSMILMPQWIDSCTKWVPDSPAGG